MINFFRKTRRKLADDNSVLKYLKYAVGEILLVVFGILIALQVNNWNEDRKSKQRINDILKTISYDLQLDTLVAGVVTKFYEEKQKNSRKIIQREMNRENYMDCLDCIALVTLYKPLDIQTKGLELLRNVIDQTSVQKDSLLTQIVHVYSLFKSNIDKSNNRVEEDVMNNLESFKSFPWFVNWIEGNFDQEMIIYFTESEDYRKKVAAHNLLAAGNHMQLISAYKQNAEYLLEKINDRLDDKE